MAWCLDSSTAIAGNLPGAVSGFPGRRRPNCAGTVAVVHTGDAVPERDGRQSPQRDFAPSAQHGTTAR